MELITLEGVNGTGKTTFGKKLSLLTGVPYYKCEIDETANKFFQQTVRYINKGGYKRDLIEAYGVYELRRLYRFLLELRNDNVEQAILDRDIFSGIAYTKAFLQANKLYDRIEHDEHESTIKAINSLVSNRVVHHFKKVYRKNDDIIRDNAIEKLAEEYFDVLFDYLHHQNDHKIIRVYTHE